MIANGRGRMACCMSRREEKDDGDIFDDGDDTAAPQKDPSPPPDPLVDDSHPESISQPQVGNTAVHGWERTMFWVSAIQVTPHRHLEMLSLRALHENDALLTAVCHCGTSCTFSPQSRPR